MQLYLVRHGQSFVNLEDWEGGFVDAGLTALGEQQAQRLARWLAQYLRQVDVLYTSTMARALQTAEIVAAALGVRAIPDDRLREYGNCFADGSPVPPEQMPIRYPHGWWGTQRPNTRISPQGESWMLFRIRVSAFLTEIVERHSIDSPPDTTVVVVCHGGVIEAAFDHVFNIGECRRVEVWSHNTGIVHLEHLPESAREVWRLHAHSQVNHLVEPDGSWLGADSAD